MVNSPDATAKEPKSLIWIRFGFILESYSAQGLVRIISISSVKLERPRQFDNDLPFCSRAVGITDKNKHISAVPNTSPIRQVGIDIPVLLKHASTDRLLAVQPVSARQHCLGISYSVKLCVANADLKGQLPADEYALPDRKKRVRLILSVTYLIRDSTLLK